MLFGFAEHAAPFGWTAVVVAGWFSILGTAIGIGIAQLALASVVEHHGPFPPFAASGFLLAVDFARRPGVLLSLAGALHLGLFVGLLEFELGGAASGGTTVGTILSEGIGGSRGLTVVPVVVWREVVLAEAASPKDAAVIGAVFDAGPDVQRAAGRIVLVTDGALEDLADPKLGAGAALLAHVRALPGARRVERGPLRGLRLGD